MKVFSKRHAEAGRDVSLGAAVRRRIWYVLNECDPLSGEGFQDWDLSTVELRDRLLKEHGWVELRSYKSQTEWEAVNTEHFITGGVPRFVLDATEIFHDLLVVQAERKTRGADVLGYQKKLNQVFEDANLPWRMLDGRIVRVDSKWLEVEIHAKAAELMSAHGFEGALAEFQEARSNLSTGDTKAAMRAANLAIESTMKAILGVGQIKPGALLRRLVDSGIVPDYHAGFLEAFEQHILRAVMVARNMEQGVGHGQGTAVNDPPSSLAELTVNLTGVLILYLLKRHFEMHPAPPVAEVAAPEALDDDIVPF